MLIEGAFGSGKTSCLINKYIDLLKSGISSSKILVIAANSYKKSVFVNKTKDLLATTEIVSLEVLKIQTFSGIVYNSIQNNWSIIEELIPKSKGNRELYPNLCGLEITQYIMKQCIEKADFADYQSGINLLHQLFRRYRLIVENCLSEKEIEEKSKFLGESFAKDANKALFELKNKTGELRSFDYLKQINTFLYLLKHNKIKDFDNIQYLLVDDFDELSFAAQSFIKFLIPKVKEYFIAGDTLGGTRRGYLCAYPDGWEELKINQQVTTLESKNQLFNTAAKLFENIHSNRHNSIENISLDSNIKRAEMLEKTILQIDTFFKNGANPRDIRIVIPVIDENTEFILSDYFTRNKIKYQILSGNKRLLDDPYIQSSLTIIQLINREWNIKPDVFEIRSLLNNILGFPVQICREIIDKYKKSKKLPKADLKVYPELKEKYDNLLSLIQELQDKKIDLYQQLMEVFSKIIAPNINENTSLENLHSLFISLENFTNIAEKLDKNNFSEKEWLIQLKNSVVVDNPAKSPDIFEDSIIITTPQKMIDLELRSKYQIWLDVSDKNWLKDDTGTLYNSWVFQKNWKYAEYTPEIHKKLTLEKTAHVIRKMILCANEHIYAFMSNLDSSGNENTGTLHEYLDMEFRKNKNSFIKITPRDDQKPVLDYKGGKLAVPAVPGAGKTTVMLALIIELLERGINPSKILVLTYMNSAARNFQNRIKKACPDLNDIPYISTIHGLAYKIIQEEDNFTKLGLSSDFRTCDDIERPKILREICSKHLPSGESEIEWFERNSIAISTAKNNKLEYKLIKEFLKDNSDQYLEEFLPVYREYVLTLKGKNLVDYDDLLIMATELLNNYPEIKKYYQNLYSYVIEDEAQDSSSVQQELISIIAGKSGNLIRCGDINQAITTTFSNSDVQGFKDFIKNSQKVEMQSSQRCAKDIYELANNLIDLSKQQNHTKNAFYDIKMKPVEGKNPTAKNSLNFNILETSDHEKQYVLKQIKQKFSENPEQTAGVLLRTNWQVYEWASFLEENGIKILCRTDSLKQIKVFRLILKLLEVIEYPWKNKPVGELFEEFINAKISKGNIETAEFIKERLGTPFITYKFISNVLPELENEPVINFWWEINYWLENSHIPPEELVTKIGNHYFKNILDRSNANLLSVLIKKYIRSFDDESINSVQLPEIVSHFKELANKNKISGVKLFSEQDETADNSLNGFVQVMTMHKAKGDEFDLVFIPEMTENNYTTDLEKVNLRNDNALIEKISELSGIIKKTAQETLTAQIEETLRLIYVGITRAGKYLYMTAPRKKQTKYGKLYDVQPSCLIMQLSEHHAGAKTEVSG